jgi:hypothetical protein
MVYIGLHFHLISFTVRTFRTKCLAPKKSSMQVPCTCLNLSQCADLLICMTAESRSRKHCSCVFQDLVPIFKEGQSASEGKIFRCPNCYLRVCINVVTVLWARILTFVMIDCIDSMRGRTAAKSRITCRRRLTREPSLISSSVRTTHDYSYKIRLHVP